MSAFPDMRVTHDELGPEPRGTRFHWTLTGTNTGPGETGKAVRISGYELWQFDGDGLISESRSHFDSADYEWQLEHGADGWRLGDSVTSLRPHGR
jgi:predicted ester cyclase